MNLKRLPRALTLATALLASCTQNVNPTTPIPATPATPPADAPTALVYGMTQSPVYEALESKLKLTPWNETQKVTDFDMVILDGDGFDVQQLQDDALIHEAVRGGVWILSLDIEEDEKLSGVGDLLGGATPERSVAYLARLIRSPNAQPTTEHVDFRDDQADADLTAGHILEYVGGKVAAQQISPDQGPTDPPKGALTWSHTFSQPHDVVLPRANITSNAPVQTASWTQSGSINLYLANRDDAYGDSQRVAIEQRGEANPNSLSVYSNNCNCNPGSDLEYYEIAWPQTQFVTEATIPSPFSLVSTSPSNVNEQSSVETSSGFEIGVNINAGLDGPTGGVSAVYNYNTTTTRTVSEWKVANRSVLNTDNSKATWAFASSSPWDGFNTSEGTTDAEGVPDASLFIASQVTVKDPNQLSQEDLSYATSSVWSTNTVSTDTVFIGGTDHAWYTNAWTVYWDGNNGDVGGGLKSDYGINRYDNAQTWGLNVNLGSVVPVPIARINVGTNNTVTAGETNTGTVTLEKPAYADAVIYLNSGSQFFTIPSETITIPKGSTTGTFAVETSNDGTCANFGAKIQAFYTTGLRQEVQVVQPSPPSPDCQR